jgi:Putative porin
MRTRWPFATLVLLFSAAASPCLADQAEELRQLRDTTISLVNALVEQGVLTREKADAIIAQARQAGAKAAAPVTTAPATANSAPVVPPAPALAPGTVRVPYVPETVKQEITTEVKQEVLAQAKSERWGEPGAFPDWLSRFNWSGDLRIREEADTFPAGNAPVPVLQSFGVNLANSTEANDRLRFRARFGFVATVSDSVSVGLRLATGGVGLGTNIGTENQTLGTYEARAGVGLDRAYLSYHPLAWLDMSAGLVGNPYLRPTTLIWADDVTLGGVVIQIHPQLTHSLQFFTTAGAYPILHVDPSPLDSSSGKWLYAYQSGFNVNFKDAAALSLAAALYDYRNIEGIPNSIFSTAYSNTAAPFRQTGNTVFDINGLLNTQNGTQNYLFGLASKFHELNVSAQLDIGFIGPVHFIVDGDWVKNLGFKENEIIARTGFQVNRQVRGWQTRFTVGQPTMQQKYAWQGYVGYRWVQRDATVDAFTDQDFHLGGTDAQGYFVGGRYSFAKNTFVNLRWFSAKQISGVQLAGADSFLTGLPILINVAQFDIMSSF